MIFVFSDILTRSKCLNNYLIDLCKRILLVFIFSFVSLLKSRLVSLKLLSLPRSQKTFADLQDVCRTSWRHVLKTSWKVVLKTSWKHVLRTSWRHVLKMSSRRLGDKQNIYCGYLYLTNLNVYLTNPEAATQRCS